MTRARDGIAPGPRSFRGLFRCSCFGYAFTLQKSGFSDALGSSAKQGIPLNFSL